MNVFESASTKVINKGTILLNKGEVCKAAYKVVKGCLKSYAIDNSGREHILQFAPEDWIISDMDSFIYHRPSLIFIDAVETSEVVLIPYPQPINFEEMDKKTLIEINNKLFRNIINSNNRLINLLCATSEERYLNFTQTYPALMQRLPLKLIASYLGMTPEYLSEVRRKLAKK